MLTKLWGKDAKHRQINNIELSANDLTARQDPKGKEQKLLNCKQH